MAEEQPGLGASWRRWGGVLGFVAVLAIIGVFLWPQGDQNSSPNAGDITPLPTPSSTTAPTNSVSSESSASATSTVGVGECPDLSTDTAFPAEAPATEWVAHPAGMYLPVSEEFGPAIRDDEFWRCFSHTPTGALFAGWSLANAWSFADVEAAAAETNRDAAFAESQEIEGSTDHVRVTGYRIVASDTQSATIDYVAQVGERQVANRIKVVWDETVNDWRLDVSEGAQAEFLEVSDPTSVTPWE